MRQWGKRVSLGEMRGWKALWVQTWDLCGWDQTMPRKVYSSLKPASPQVSSLSPQTTEFDISQKTEGISWGKSVWVSRSQLIIFPKKLFLSFRMLKYILFGLLPLLSVNGVVGEHRIKLEKGYNMQERPASGKEGEPLEIQFVSFLNCSQCPWFKWQTEFYLFLSSMVSYVPNEKIPQRASINLRNILDVSEKEQLVSMETFWF